VSFQRYPLPESGVLEEAPRSWGALPVAIASNGEAMVPLDRGEAIWIGVSVPREDPGPSAACVHVTATRDDASHIDVLSGVAATAGAAGWRVPPTASVTGITRSAGGWFAIARTVPDGSPSRSIRSLAFVAVPTRSMHVPEPPRRDLPMHSLALGSGPSRPPVATCDDSTDANEWDESRRTTLTVTLVAYEDFRAASDIPLPEPLHSSEPYRGWRLP
jgi:hypothetical protein